MSWKPVRRRVPNNHSCLFECFAVLCRESLPGDAPTASSLRRVCANVVMADPDPETTSLMLGMPVDQYAVWIVNEMNWGGENEIVTLCEHFGVEVAIVSCESFSVLVYGQIDSEPDRSRIYLLYTGQHYDPIVSHSLEGGEGVGDESDTSCATILPASVTEVPEYQSALVAIAKTHVDEFQKKLRERRVKRIKCLGCGAILDDNLAFQEHCMTVEHDDDFAYDCEEVEVVESGDEAAPKDRLDLTAESTLTFYNLADVWFSPLYSAPILIDGTTYLSTEHHFQWCRFHEKDPSFAASLLEVTQADDLVPLVSAQEYSKQKSDWETVKSDVLLRGIRAKVEQHPEIAEKLLATADKTLVLIDPDPWAGVQAGDGIPTGRNAAGEAWMQVRRDMVT